VNLPKASDIAMLARFLRSLDKKFKILLRTKLLSGLDLFFIFKIGKIQAKKSDLLGERKSKQAGMPAGKL